MYTCKECGLPLDICNCEHLIDGVTDRKIVFCLKLWLKELKESSADDSPPWSHDGLMAQLENEILNGSYCDDDEYTAYLVDGKI